MNKQQLIKKCNKTLVKKYINRTGKQNFTSSYYYLSNNNKGQVIFSKALLMDVLNFNDKINKHRELQAIFETLDEETIQNMNKIIDIVYCEICR